MQIIFGPCFIFSLTRNFFCGNWLEEYSSEFNSNFHQLNLLEAEDYHGFEKLVSLKYKYTSPENQNEINQVKYVAELIIKVGLSSSNKNVFICFNESTLKMMKMLYLKSSFDSQDIEGLVLNFSSCRKRGLKDDKKLNKKHIKIQMTQPSFRTYACNEGCIIDLCSIDVLIAY